MHKNYLLLVLYCRLCFTSDACPWMWVWNKCGSSFATQSHGKVTNIVDELIYWLCVGVTFQHILLFHTYARGLEMRPLLNLIFIIHPTVGDKELSFLAKFTQMGQHQVEVHLHVGCQWKQPDRLASLWHGAAELSRGRWTSFGGPRKRRSLAINNTQMTTSLILFSNTCFLLLRLSLGFTELYSRTHSRPFEVKCNR